MYISAEPTLVCKVLSPHVFYRTGVPTRTGESESESGVSFLDPSGRKAEKTVRKVFHAARCRTHAGTRKGLIQNVNTIEDAGWWSYAFKQGASRATSHPASSVMLAQARARFSPPSVRAATRSGVRVPLESPVCPCSSVFLRNQLFVRHLWPWTILMLLGLQAETQRICNE